MGNYRVLGAGTEQSPIQNTPEDTNTHQFLFMNRWVFEPSFYVPIIVRDCAMDTKRCQQMHIKGTEWLKM